MGSASRDLFVEAMAAEEKGKEERKGKWAEGEEAALEDQENGEMDKVGCPRARIPLGFFISAPYWRGRRLGRNVGEESGAWLQERLPVRGCSRRSACGERL